MAVILFQHAPYLPWVIFDSHEESSADELELPCRVWRLEKLLLGRPAMS